MASFKRLTTLPPSLTCKPLSQAGAFSLGWETLPLVAESVTSTEYEVIRNKSVTVTRTKGNTCSAPATEPAPLSAPKSTPESTPESTSESEPAEAVDETDGYSGSDG